MEEDDVHGEVGDAEMESKRMSIKGTAPFLAPELVAADKSYSEKIDIYSLAVTFIEIWTGEDPWKDEKIFQIYQAVQSGKRPTIPHDMPASLKQIVKLCWHQTAAVRPSAEALTHLLQEMILTEYGLDMSRQQQPLFGKLKGCNIADAAHNSFDEYSSGLGIIPDNIGRAVKSVSRRLSLSNNAAAHAAAVNAFTSPAPGAEGEKGVVVGGGSKRGGGTTSITTSPTLTSASYPSTIKRMSMRSSNTGKALASAANNHNSSEDDDTPGMSIGLGNSLSSNLGKQVDSKSEMATQNPLNSV
jgi:hypothetical protein